MPAPRTNNYEPTKVYFSRKEAMKILDCNRRWIDHMTAEMGFTKVEGRHYRYSVDELNRLTSKRMDKPIKIEQGIEPPARTTYNDKKYPFKDMKPGDSFEVGMTTQKSAYSLQSSLMTSARNWRSKNGLEWVFKTAQMGDGRVRIWRVE